MKYVFENVSAEKMQEGIKKIMMNGGEITDSSFEISGVEGRYHYEYETLTVMIDEKPWLASWEMIEEKLNEFF